MELIDSHTHLDFADFDADRQALLAQSRALGVKRMVVLGVYQANWQRVWDLVQSDPDLHAAFGLHPVYLDQHRPADLTELADWLTHLAGHRQLCAVGEFGLDFFSQPWIASASRCCLKRSCNWPGILPYRRCCMCAAVMPRSSPP